MSEVVAREDSGDEIDDSKSAPHDRDTAGPFDIAELPSMRPYVDLGSIKVAPREGLQLRLDVDEKAKRVVAISLDYAESTLQVQAFSAPKSTGLWHEVRTQIAKQLLAQGLKAQAQDGVLGPELVATINVPEARGGGTAPVKFIGVDGPRWLLRGAITGKAVQDTAAGEQVVDLFRELVIVRGDGPMPPNELLPLKVPAGAQAKGE